MVKKQNKEVLKDFKKSQKEKGLCIYCNNKIVKGKTMCKYHLDYHKWRKKFVKKGDKK